MVLFGNTSKPVFTYHTSISYDHMPIIYGTLIYENRSINTTLMMPYGVNMRWHGIIVRK